VGKKKTKQRHKVEKLGKDNDIINYCIHAFPLLGSKSACKKAIKADRLLLNGALAKSYDKLKVGDTLTLIGSKIHQAKKLDMDLDVVFEDDHIIVVNKPGGIAVNGNRFKTLENALVGYHSNLKDSLPRPIAVHRIDVPTTGLVLFAKTKSALIILGKAFQEKEVKKEYHAIVHGKPAEKGKIDKDIQSKMAITKYEKLQSVSSKFYTHLSLLKLIPVTGRTHQLRIHLHAEGHLIVGDKQYADNQKTILGKGLMLCSTRLKFKHPQNNKEMDIQIKMPKKFMRVLDRETKISKFKKRR
jgi:RluA family pseudouridine synthase